MFFDSGIHGHLCATRTAQYPNAVRIPRFRSLLMLDTAPSVHFRHIHLIQI